MTDWVSRLCTQVGISAQYRGFDGETVHVSPETQGAVLRAMGLDVAGEAEAKSLLKEMLTETSARPLPPEEIVRAGRKSTLSTAHPVDWMLEAEGTGTELASGKATDSLTLPPLPLGIYCLRLRSDTNEHTTWVLARPARAVQLEDHIAKPRIWGVLAALYGLTDGDTTEIGTYDSLGAYGAAMASHGADFLGVNPVHAMGQVRPDDVISPYSPSHRGFLNTWHCAGLGKPPKGTGDLVDYPAALQANVRALSDQYTGFSNLPESDPQKLEFGTFTADAGSALHDFALFEVLAAHYGADWRDWPAAYRDRDAKALAAIETNHAKDIAWTKWSQWQAETQLARAQAKVQHTGMRLGLYLDLAVGPRLGGAETWAKDTTLITGATLGAPPDPLGPQGQSWGLAPQSPLKCRADGYAGFARLMRATMRHAGMIRIDHVLGLMRSFWIPEGGTEGTYVSYPLDALLAIVAIESQRNNTIVVGEDLGLVPDGLRKALKKSGIYGLDVLQYMRTAKGGFVAPSKTRKQAVCSFATHDTPTIAGFFAADDARVRHQFGGIDSNTLERTRSDRNRARKTLASADPVTEIHRQLARSNASAVAVQLDDVAGRTAQQNLPGTVDTYPNWRLKAPFTVADIATSDTFACLARDMRAEGRSNDQGMETQDDLSDCSDLAH